MTETLTVRPAGRDEAEAIVAAIGRAGLDEAVFSWVVPDEAARRARVAAWAEHATDWVSGLLASGEVLVVREGTEEILGLSVWEFRPAGPDRTAPATAAGEAALLEQAYGEHAPRMSLVGDLIRRRHPDREAHWYLQQMAVAPACRGRGLGGALLRHQLARADAAAVPAYLEASSPRNRALYERHGFRAHGQPIRLPDGGPVLQPMWRSPRTTGTTVPAG